MANKKISDLTAGSALTGTELIEVEQSSTSKYTTPSDLKTYMQSNLSLITSGTAQATTSGTSIDFTSIPATVKRITIMLDGVSLTGNDFLMVQIGDAGGIETSGYVGTAGRGTNQTALANGFYIDNGANGPNTVNGSMVLTLLDASTFTWSCMSVFGIRTNTFITTTAGTKSLTATLDRVRLTSQGGADTFDAGKVNILYE